MRNESICWRMKEWNNWWMELLFNLSSSLPPAIGQQSAIFINERRRANQRQLTNSIKWNLIEWIGELFDWIKRIVVLLPSLFENGLVMSSAPLRGLIPFHEADFIPFHNPWFHWTWREEEIKLICLSLSELEGKWEVNEWMVAGAKTYNQPPVIQQSLIVNEGPAKGNHSFHLISSTQRKTFFFVSSIEMKWNWRNKKVL